ncbi:MAG: cytochrome b/b6 domain-containing protein [Deltaproteobacteria bacterium]|nr:cytochrome b/b6 domain-containing protein [Deltaproteobacteria bacterium]
MNHSVERLSKNQRIQHIILLVSMIMLSITGLALKFHNNSFSVWLIRIEGGIWVRGLIHRIFAIVLILLALYHVLWVTFTDEGHRELMAVTPRFKDVTDFLKKLLYNLGLSNQQPRFDKYDYLQKLQYWGVVIGTMIMVITGIVLWFVNQSMAVLPKWAIDVTMLIHGWDGVMIFIVLFLFHLYNVHLNPEVFPMSKTWIDGKISIDRLKHEHKLEYDRLLQDKEDENK